MAASAGRLWRSAATKASGIASSAASRASARRGPSRARLSSRGCDDQNASAGISISERRPASTVRNSASVSGSVRSMKNRAVMTFEA